MFRRSFVWVCGAALSVAALTPVAVFAQVQATTTGATSTITTTISSGTATTTITSTATSTAATLATSTISTPVVVATTTSVSTTVSTQPFLTAAQIKPKVEAYFADIPVMIQIARCESGYRQFADSGHIFHGGTDNAMVGIFQIYSTIHRAFALSMGMDINTVDGNIAYARYLYQHQGTSPWLDSMSCWNATPVLEGTVTPPPLTLDKTLTLGMNDPEVAVLQKLLNSEGFTVSATGAGSPGNETTSFGGLTRTAVRAFQCAKNIVCGGDEYTTSYGIVGPRTRQALITFAPSSGSGTTSANSGSSGTSVSTTTQANAAEAARVASINAQIAELQAQINALKAQLPK